jgi:hypothetical protein
MRAKFIYEKFTDESDPISDMGIGLKHLIEEWIKQINLKSKNLGQGSIQDYFIDDEGFINSKSSISFADKCGDLPSYINFKYSGGTVYMNRCNLTSLRGAPEKANGDFYCNDNKLTSLEYAPRYVGGNFHCNDNKLTSLEYAPTYVGGDFVCMNNAVKFTVKDVRDVCKVKGNISV